MSQPVHITLTEQEKNFLFDLVRASIERGLDGKTSLLDEGLPPPPTSPEGSLCAHLGAFVTLHLHGELRGCMGMMRPIGPLYTTVAAMAWAAAFQDARFSPLTREEWADVSFEISILGPTSPCPDINQIELGKHGILLESRGRAAVFLPEVPVEQGWSVRGTLENLCRKADLPPGTWRDRTATVYWYESTLIRP